MEYKITLSNDEASINIKISGVINKQMAMSIKLETHSLGIRH